MAVRWLSIPVVILALHWVASWRCSDPRHEPETTDAILDCLAAAVVRFHGEFDRTPRELDELTRPGRSGYPFIGRIPLDGWGRRIQYSSSPEPEGRRWVLRSVGPDGHAGTSDDRAIEGSE